MIAGTARARSDRGVDRVEDAGRRRPREGYREGMHSRSQRDLWLRSSCPEAARALAWSAGAKRQQAHLGRSDRNRRGIARADRDGRGVPTGNPNNDAPSWTHFVRLSIRHPLPMNPRPLPSPLRTPPAAALLSASGFCTPSSAASW